MIDCLPHCLCNVQCVSYVGVHSRLMSTRFTQWKLVPLKIQCTVGSFCIMIFIHSIQIFSRYEKHRDLILEDIFASLRRLPTTKRNLRSFKLVDSTTYVPVSLLILFSMLISSRMYGVCRS